MFAWARAGVCVGAPQVVRHDKKSSADEKSKWVLFCVDRRTVCILFLSQWGQINVHTLL